MFDMQDKIKNWIQAHAEIMGKFVSLVFLVFGVLVVIGAFKNWDWLYKPDTSVLSLK